MLIWLFTSAAESHWRKHKRFGTKGACPPFPFIPDTHSRTLNSPSEKAKQKPRPAAWQWRFGKCVSLNKKFLDFLAESSWGRALQRSSGCLSHLKMQSKDNAFGWEGLNSSTKSTIPIWGTRPDSRAAAHGPCRAQWIVSKGFFFLQTQAGTERKILLPKPPALLRAGEACQTLGRVSLTRSLHRECQIKHIPWTFTFFPSGQITLYVLRKNTFFHSLCDFWKPKAR